ncbi:MAG: nucleoside-diphosphate kinase [Actinomycetota bacterium]
MAIESTLLIVKPDGVRRGLIGEVLRRVEAKGLVIESMRLSTIDRSLAEQHYAEHVDKPFFRELVDFITGGPVVVAKVTGESAIDAWRTLIGPTNPIEAPPGSIRGDLATLIGENIVHGSDSPASAARELGLFFPEG